MGCCFSTTKVADVKPERVVAAPKRSQEVKKASSKPSAGGGGGNEEFLDEDFESQITEWIRIVSELNNNGDLTSYALDKDKSHFKTLDALADYLSKGPYTNDLEKVWLLYVWITDNIAYDGEGYRENRNIPTDGESVLASGKTVCYGYAEIFSELAAKLHIECRIVSGYSKAFGYEIGSRLDKENHAWNAVKLSNRWQYIEATWGAGYIDRDFLFIKRFQPYYFLTPPNIFIERHFCESFQLQKKKMTLAQFESLQVNEIEFYLLRLKLKSFETCKIVAETRPFLMEYESTQELALSTKLTDVKANRALKNQILVQNDFLPASKVFRYCLIVDLPQSNKKYKLELFGKTKDENEHPGSISPLLSEYELIREGERELDVKDMPKYKLTFDFNIKLMSHSSKWIKFETNPLSMRFSIPTTTLTTFELSDLNGNKLENALFQHCDPSVENKTYVNVVLPVHAQTFVLNLFGKLAENQGGVSFRHLSTFHLARTKSDANDNMQLVHVLASNKKFFIYNPLSYILKASQSYEFKYYIKDAVKVALLNGKKNWFYLEKKAGEKDVWTLEKAIPNLGELSLFATYNPDTSCTGICKYTVIS